MKIRKEENQYRVEFLIYEENLWYELGCWGRNYQISFYFNEKVLIQQDYMESDQQPQWGWYQLPYLLPSAQKEWKKKMVAAILKSFMHYIYIFDIKYLNFPPFSPFEDVLAV